jgi:hypothetical protein
VNDSAAAASSTAAVQAPGSYTFRVRVTDTNGFAVAGTVGVTVSAGPGALVVSPYEVQVSGGQTAAFRADGWDQLGNRITASPAWTVSGGGTIDTNGLFTAVTAGGPFTVTATAAGLSATGLVWVTSSQGPTPPCITTQPLSRAVAAGSNVTLNVTATGSLPLTYQWTFGGTNIAGATGGAYTRTNVQSADAGSYLVVVSGSAGCVTSAPAILTVNNAPSLEAIPNRTIHAGSTLSFTNQASDIDAPPQTLTFSLDPGAPPGATIGPASGVFVWNTGPAQANTTNVVTVRATDNGSPSLSAVRTFAVTVVAPLAIQSISLSNSNITLTWPAISGTAYQVQYRDSLGGSSWNSLGPAVVAGGPLASANDPVGTTQRFYRLLLVK